MSLSTSIQRMREQQRDEEHKAMHDALTSLPNRRYLSEWLAMALAAARRGGQPMAILFFDLDGFKLVNDTHGHAGGDAVLAHFAQILLKNVRDSDVVGRLGGDEFGVLLSHANQDQAHKKADQLANSLNASPTIFQGRAIPASFSYGAFELKPGEDAAVAMARADEAMYAHKRSSR
jgi:diguanylate cyclase (GGDEF)-like protein